MTDRREFMSRCAIGAASALAPVSVLAAEGSGSVPGAALPYGVSKATFQSLIAERFRCMTGAGHAVGLELIEVWDGPQSPEVEQFGLLLRGDGTIGAGGLPEGLYRLYHPRTGAALVRLAPSDSVPGAYATHFGLLT